MKFKVWCDSGANVHSCRTETVTLDELGLSDEEWAEMTESERDGFMRDVAFSRLDWGYAEEDE